jgi:hypothetical protein
MVQNGPWQAVRRRAYGVFDAAVRIASDIKYKLIAGRLIYEMNLLSLINLPLAYIYCSTI